MINITQLQASKEDQWLLSIYSYYVHGMHQLHRAKLILNPLVFVDVFIAYLEIKKISLEDFHNYLKYLKAKLSKKIPF
jgi:hypothetical protein